MRRPFSACGWLAALLWIAVPGSRAQAVCIGPATGALARLEDIGYLDPHAVMAEIQKIEANVEQASRLTNEDRAVMLALTAEAHRRMSKYPEALRTAERGLQLLGVENKTAVALRLRIDHAMILGQSNDVAAAMREFNQVIVDANGNAVAIACAKNDRGFIRFSNGDTLGALRDYLEAFEVFKAAGLKDMEMTTAPRLVDLYRIVSAYDSALALIPDIIEYYKANGSAGRLADMHARIGNIYADQGRPHEAIAEYEAAKAIMSPYPAYRETAVYQLLICRAQTDLKDYANALTSCRTAERGLRENGGIIPGQAAIYHLNMARIALETQDPKTAATAFKQALATKAAVLNTRTGVRVYKGLAEAEALLGNHRAAHAAAAVYAQRLVITHDQQAAQEVAVMQVKADLKREAEKTAALAREKMLLLDLNAKAASETRLIIALAVLGSLAIAVFVLLISQRRRAEAERLVVETRSEELSRICSGVAHDFNNLLTVVRQGADILVRKAGPHPNTVENRVAESIRQAAQAGSEITRQLLSFGRQMQLKPRAVNCREYFRHHTLLLDRAANNRAAVNVQAMDVALAMWVDPAQLTSALINLILNACDSMVARGTIRIRVGAASGLGGFIRITVSDNGKGMTAEILQRCTDVFFTTKETGVGIGLGLSAVQGFMQQSGGTLDIKSEVGKGTVVTLDLPDAQDST